MNLTRVTRRILAPVAAAAAVTALALPAGTAQATTASTTSSSSRATATVTVANMAFGPAAVTSALGGKVTWSFADPIAHTTTSDDGFWDSGARTSGTSYTHRFTSAGSFGYHCAIHPMMRGSIKVPVKTKGSATSGWKLRWSTHKGKHHVTFDVQTRRGSGRWTSFVAGTTKAGGRFDPAKAGSYDVRARTVKGGARSGWSPTVTVTVS